MERLLGIEGWVGNRGGRFTNRSYRELWWRDGLGVDREWVPAFAGMGERGGPLMVNRVHKLQVVLSFCAAVEDGAGVG